MQIKPFLKWVGGKTKLLNEIDQKLPDFVKNSSFNYVEPFLGGGAVFFYLISKYKIKTAYLNDLNNKLIRTYTDVRDNLDALINELSRIENDFKKSKDQKNFYLDRRFEFNCSKLSIKKSALFIFLNKTCFNGMYRENSKGEFNIPFGQMKNPKICDVNLLSEISRILNNNDVVFTSKSFEEFLLKKKNTFYYLDPPYRPISQTSHFTSYNSGDDNERLQLSLKKYCDLIKKNKNYFMQSNSQSKDYFFENLYKDYHITKLDVMRTIAADDKKRGNVVEILISNYEQNSLSSGK